MRMSTLELVDEALAIRAEASLTSNCPRCDSETDPTGFVPDGVGHRAIRHDDWCPAENSNLEKALRRSETEIVHYAVHDEAANTMCAGRARTSLRERDLNLGGSAYAPEL